MERCLPPDAPADVPDDAEVTRRAALLALRALGVARTPHIRAHFTRGRYPTLARDAHGLHAEGVIEPVAIEGVKGDWWVRAEDVRDAPGALERHVARPHRAALAVRQPALRPRPDRGAVRLLAPAGDLHAEGQAPLGLLRAADPARRPADRPRRPAHGPPRRPPRRARRPPRGRRAQGKAIAEPSAASSSGSRRGRARRTSRSRPRPAAWPI